MQHLAITLAIVLGPASILSAQGYAWGATSAGKLVDEGKAVCLGSDGSCYVTGSFTSATFALGDVKLSNTSATPTDCDLFVARLDKAGKVAWAIQSNGAGDEKGIDIACDKTGHVVVVGVFKGPGATFGATELKNQGVNSFSTVIMRLDPAGKILWAQRAGGTSETFVKSVSCGPEGEICVTGAFKYGTTFGGFEHKSKSGNNSSVFVARFDSAGALKWFEQIHGKGKGGQHSRQSGEAVFATPDGQFVYIAGWFHGHVTFGSGVVTSNDFEVKGSGWRNFFITKYFADGKCAWTQTIGVGQVNLSTEPEVTDLCADAQGNAYVTGYFPGVLAFGAETMRTAPSVNSWNHDIFLAKLDGDGKHLWHVSAGGRQADKAQAIAPTPDGVVITGAVTGDDVKFGDITLPAGFGNAFVARYDANGKCLRSTGAKAVVSSSGNGVATDGASTVVTGTYLGSGITLGEVGLSGAGSGNVFVAGLKN